MKKNKITILMIGVTSLILVSTARAENGLKEGKWSMTMQTQMEGMPQMHAGTNDAKVDVENGHAEVKTSKGIFKVSDLISSRLGKKDLHMNMQNGGQTVTVTQCITNDNLIPKQKENSKCEKPQIKRNGNVVDYSMVCNGKSGKMEINGHSVFHGDTMEGSSKMHSNFSGREMTMTTQTTGKYLGPCDK